MEQNGVTPEDIMKEITAEEVQAEAVGTVAEEEVSLQGEEQFAEETYIEETAETTEPFVAQEEPVEKPLYTAYEEPVAAFSNANVYGDYNAAPNYMYEPYEQNYGGEGFCITALVLGIVGFFLNPCYIVSILAIVFGFIGQSKNNSKKALAIWGWALGIAAIVLQILGDFVLSICSGGTGLFVFCC